MKIRSFTPDDAIPGFDVATLKSQRADCHLVAGDGAARCSLWWSVVPPMVGERPGVVRHFSAESAEAGTAVLDAATARLAEASRMFVGVGSNGWQHLAALSGGDRAGCGAAIFYGTGQSGLVE